MNGQQGSSFGLGLLMGVIIGGVIALLYAPKSGKETRAFIRERLAGASETLGDKVSSVRHTIGEKISGGECSATGSSVSEDGA
jgi:gas vesicle protein